VTRSIQGKENDFDEQLWAGQDVMEGRCLQHPGELQATPLQAPFLGPPEGIKYLTLPQLIRN
jgi:hypothetical protein